MIQLVKALLNANRPDEARMFVGIAHQKLAAIKDPIYKSDSCELVAEALALLGEWDRAVETAERCEQEIDKLAACTAIVREYSLAQDPSLAEVFRKAAKYALDTNRVSTFGGFRGSGGKLVKGVDGDEKI